ncbi:MAG: FtsX-like permease family protein [Wujia sp.]
MKNGMTYKVVGTIPDNLGIDYVLDNSQHDNMRRMFFSTKKGFYVYTDDVEAVISHYRKMAKEYDDILDDSFVSINVPYNDEIQEINKELEENISINPEMKNIVYIMVVIISIITIYFNMKSDSRRRGNEVAVYRLMGIPKKDIKAVYLLEMTILTIRVCATAVILTGIAVKLITSIPSLEITLYCPWWILGIVIVCFISINGIISVAPVPGLLRKPPVHFVE